jgi:hypothetical protein
VNDALITKLGRPVAHPKLTSQPLASTISRIVAQCVDVDLAVKMADVADDQAVLHMPHVVDRDHIDIAGRGDKEPACEAASSAFRRGIVTSVSRRDVSAHPSARNPRP